MRGIVKHQNEAAQLGMILMQTGTQVSELIEDVRSHGAAWVAGREAEASSGDSAITVLRELRVRLAFAIEADLASFDDQAVEMFRELEQVVREPKVVRLLPEPSQN